MPDILIRGMEMPREDDLLCLNIHPNGDVTINLDLKCIPIARAVELPPHGDLIDVSKIVLEYGGLAKIAPHDFVGIAKYFAKQIEGQPVVVPTEMVSKAHEEFIKEANKNRAIKHEQEVKNFRDFAISLRDEAREIKNGNAPFPERSDK